MGLTGQYEGYHESYRSVPMEVNLLKKLRLEIAVNENFVEGAHTGQIGDGTIFVVDLSEYIRL